jgi:MFS family permease
MKPSQDARIPLSAATGVGVRVVALLALAAFINYVDRGNLATAGPLIRDELALSNAQLGMLLSAFFWSYAPAQLLVGWLAERFDARLVLAAGLAVWGGATVLTGIAGGFAMILLLRLVLGLGESVMYPASFKILARDALDEQRGRANGLLAAGQSLGPAFGTLIGGLLMAWLGWRAVFVAVGLASLLWLWPWLTTPRSVGGSPATSPLHRLPRSLELLRNRELWGSCIGQFCETYSLYLVLSWLPVYLVKARGFSITEMAQIGAGIYAFYAVTSIITGWGSDRWRMAGATQNRVRKTSLITGLLLIAGCLVLCSYTGQLGSVLALIGCGVGFGIATPAIFASAQILAGPDAAARWMGVQNFVGNLAGITAPVVTGIAVDRTGSFSAGFVIAALVALVGILAYGVIVRRIEPIDWPINAQAGEPTVAR